MQKWMDWLRNNKDNIIGKAVIIDTNAFIHRLDILDVYINDTVIIPDIVLDELEKLYKVKLNDKGRIARNIIFKKLMNKRQRLLIASVGKYRGYVDDILIDGCISIMNMSSVTLVTGDKNLYMKATGNGILVSFIEASNDNFEEQNKKSCQINVYSPKKNSCGLFDFLEDYLFLNIITRLNLSTLGILGIMLGLLLLMICIIVSAFLAVFSPLLYLILSIRPGYTIRELSLPISPYVLSVGSLFISLISLELSILSLYSGSEGYIYILLIITILSCKYAFYELLIESYKKYLLTNSVIILFTNVLAIINIFVIKQNYTGDIDEYVFTVGVSIVAGLGVYLSYYFLKRYNLKQQIM